MFHSSTRAAGNRRLGHAKAAVNPACRSAQEHFTLAGAEAPLPPGEGFGVRGGRVSAHRRGESSISAPHPRPLSRWERGDHRHFPARGNVKWPCRLAGVLVAGALLMASSVAAAESLLSATMPDGDGSSVAFRLDAQSRDKVVGGRIFLDAAEYEISRVSRLGLIGARRFVRDGGDGGSRYAEFLVMSSSFSDQTAVGVPWVAAAEAYGCEQPYNTFLAVYRVEGEAAVKALGPIPYPELAENRARSHHSRVFCFMARPPK